ncbi:MAG: DNA repair protein RadC [Wolbachia endosymbiont of Xenopsylla cheopis]
MKSWSLLLYRAQPNVREIVYRLIGKLGSITKIFSANIYDLKSVEGVNDAVVTSILCVKEILKRILQEEIETLPIISNWKKLIDYLKVSVGMYDKMNFRVIYLNKKYRIIADELQRYGTVDGAPLYIRNIIKRALSLRATSIIVSHNHLSGNVRPSEDDIDITKKLSLACHYMEIECMDHIIVTPKRYFSFKEKGLL